MSQEAPGFHGEALNYFEGSEAYSFLLQVSTGLMSEMRGEADVFGQMKTAWKNFTGDRIALDHCMNKLFEDTKEIRAQYLQNVGSGSYGSIVRRLIRSHSASETEPVLLVGAGHLAQTIAPWLMDHPLWISNRSSENLHKLIEDLVIKARPDDTARIKAITSEKVEAEAWARAVHVVICIPVDSERDAWRIQNWEAGSKSRARTGSIIHLGALRAQTQQWSHLSGFHPLEDIFALQKLQSEACATQFERALKACHEKARLRMLSDSAGASISLAHGWEDLAAFA